MWQAKRQGPLGVDAAEVPRLRTRRGGLGADAHRDAGALERLQIDIPAHRVEVAAIESRDSRALDRTRLARLRWVWNDGSASRCVPRVAAVVRVRHALLARGAVFRPQVAVDRNAAPVVRRQEPWGYMIGRAARSGTRRCVRRRPIARRASARRCVARRGRARSARHGDDFGARGGSASLGNRTAAASSEQRRESECEPHPPLN